MIASRLGVLGVVLVAGLVSPSTSFSNPASPGDQKGKSENAAAKNDDKPDHGKPPVDCDLLG